MTTQIVVPEMGESITEAVLVRWLKQDGERVNMDEALCVLETDKADVELPSPGTGILRQTAQPDQTVRAGEPLGSIEEAAAPPTTAPASVGPAVRRLLHEHQLSVAKVTGTGPDGRVTLQDVQAHVKEAATGTPPEKPAAAGEPTSLENPKASLDSTRREPMSRLRKRIAQRLVSVQQQTAMLTTFNEVDMQQVMGLRRKHKEAFAERHGVTLGLSSFFAHAVCIAIQSFPVLNAQIDGDDVVYFARVHLGLAVSTDRGLVVPVLKNADNMSLAELERHIKQLATQAREGTIDLSALSGGTFTITNGGIFGSLLSTPILNPPQSGILGMHAIKERPVAVDGQVVIRPMMYVALSYDHRIVDGRESVSFLVRLKELLEDPTRLLLQL